MEEGISLSLQGEGAWEIVILPRKMFPTATYRVFQAKIDKKERLIWLCGCCRNFYDIFVVSYIAPIFGPVFGWTEFLRI